MPPVALFCPIRASACPIACWQRHSPNSGERRKPKPRPCRSLRGNLLSARIGIARPLGLCPNWLLPSRKLGRVPDCRRECSTDTSLQMSAIGTLPPSTQTATHVRIRSYIPRSRRLGVTANNDPIRTKGCIPTWIPRSAGLTLVERSVPRLATAG